MLLRTSGKAISRLVRRLFDRSSSGHVTGLYLLGGTSWILLTDVLLRFGQPVNTFQLIKGLLFIIVTSAILHSVLDSYQAAIREAERERQHAGRLESLGELAATVAHEMNNVLMAIKAWLSVLRAAGSNPRQSLALERIDGAVRRGEAMTSEILQFGRKPVLEVARHSLAELVGQCVAELRPVVSDSITFRLEAGEAFAEVDALQIKSVLSNLIVNACDAMPEGGILTISCRYAAAWQRPPGNLFGDAEEVVDLSVRDTGSGIAPDGSEKIFQPFYTTKKHGTGLGLALSQRVIRAHGGTITVDSTPGKGTTFHLFLPGGR